MSFHCYKEFIEDGDTVILFMGNSHTFARTVQRGHTDQTRFGALRHDDLIGKQFGRKIQTGKGYCIALHPTPELWTVNLTHRTQILYTTDISVATMQLDLKPGSVVCESGTGSGSMSHAIIRTVMPYGHLYTYDFHAERVEKARKEFAAHGVSDYVTVSHRDVCADGFDHDSVADAVFLDLPSPWLVIPHAKKALKSSGGRVCSFSPCIEQVSKTCAALRETNFCDIKTVECLLRTFEVRDTSLPKYDFDQKSLKRATATDNRDETRNKTKAMDDGTNQEKSDGLDADDVTVDEEEDDQLKHDELAMDCSLQSSMSSDASSSKSKKAIRGKGSWKINKGADVVNYKTANAQLSIPGHTGYLTFASLYPTG